MAVCLSLCSCRVSLAVLFAQEPGHVRPCWLPSSLGVSARWLCLLCAGGPGVGPAGLHRCRAGEGAGLGSIGDRRLGVLAVPGTGAR